MPLAPQLSVPHIGQISASPITRDNMKASKPKLSFSIDSIVGKRKTFESDSALQSSNVNQTELLAKSIKRHLSENMDLSTDRRSNGSPVSTGARSPDTCHLRDSISPLSTGSLSVTPNSTANQPTGTGSPLRSPSPLSLVTHAQSPNQNTLANAVSGQFLNRQMGMPAASHPSMGNMPQPTSAGQMPQVAGLGHPNHPMMATMAAAAAAAASSAHQFPPMPSDYQQAAAFYPWFLRASPFAGRFPGKCRGDNAYHSICVLSASNNV